MIFVDSNYTVNAGVTVTTTSDGSPVFRILYNKQSPNLVDFANHGSIVSTAPNTAVGVDTDFSGGVYYGYFENYGLIQASASASRSLAYGFFDGGHGPHVFLNAGTISASATGRAAAVETYQAPSMTNAATGLIKSNNPDPTYLAGIAYGVFMHNGGLFTNDGAIRVVGAGQAWGVNIINFEEGPNILLGDGTPSSGGIPAVVNNGEITVSSQEQAYGIAVTGLEYHVPLTSPNIINTGTITATTAIIAYNGGYSPPQAPEEWLSNSGHINGNVNLGPGKGHIDNTGTINGNIFLGGQNDIVDSRGGTISGDIQLGEGNNLCWGGDTGDHVVAGSGADVIHGGGGNDVIDAWFGDDLLDGGIGNDILNGAGNFDTAAYGSASTSDSWHRNLDGSWTVSAGSEGTDTLTSVERLHFTDRDVYLDPAKETLFGDGTSDILFRNVAANGATGLWAVQGSTITNAATIGFIGSDWTLVTTGDFSGDGKADLIWLHAGDGVAAEWQMNGSSPAYSAVIGGVGSDWHVVGAGDFNRDGLSDLLWRANDGTVAVWTMNGFTHTGASVIGQVDANWQVSGVADFDGDGHDEILWRHSNGLVATWSTDGSSITGANNIGYVDTSWTLAGTGDFNGDGRADILWVHSGDGAVVIWEMNGSSIQSSGLVGSVDSAWHVADVGDYNGDGKDDILWRHDNGVVAVWTMDGTSVTAAGIAGTISTDWSII